MNHYENEYKVLLVSLTNKASSFKIKIPVKILAIVKKYTSPNFAFDQFMFQELNNIKLAKFYLHEPPSRFTAQEKRQVTTLIAWLISSLSNWNKLQDSDYFELKTLLIILNSFDVNGYLYEILPYSIKSNTELLDELQNIISKLKYSFSTKSEKTPIWEREAVVQFETAISNKDWVKISDLLRAFEQSLFPNFLLAEMIKLLAALDFTRLCNAFCDSQDVIILITSVYALTTEQNLLLGVRSGNPFVEFVTFYYVLSGRCNKNGFNSEEEIQIVNILKKVSKDVVRFKAWMDIFNKYPVRYPILQTALGLFLAKSNEESIFDIYISSIELDASNNVCRESEKCFDTFRKNSNIESRKIMWNKSYERWIEWKFEINMTDKYLFKVSFSLLDFALVGYFLECLSEDERNQYQQDILDKMNNLNVQWYKNKSDFITHWYLLLSHFQPVVHASKITENDSWIMKDIYYTPNQFSNNTYFDMLLG